MAMAREAIELHIEGLSHAGYPVPGPTPIEQLRRNPDYRDGIWAIVAVDAAGLRASPAA
jgi:hypothetical protein